MNIFFSFVIFIVLTFLSKVHSCTTSQTSLCDLNDSFTAFEPLALLLQQSSTSTLLRELIVLRSLCLEELRDLFNVWSHLNADFLNHRSEQRQRILQRGLLNYALNSSTRSPLVWSRALTDFVLHAHGYSPMPTQAQFDLQTYQLYTFLQLPFSKWHKLIQLIQLNHASISNAYSQFQQNQTLDCDGN